MRFEETKNRFRGGGSFAFMTSVRPKSHLIISKKKVKKMIHLLAHFGKKLALGREGSYALVAPFGIKTILDYWPEKSKKCSNLYARFKKKINFFFRGAIANL